MKYIISHTEYSIDELSAMVVMKSQYNPVIFFGENHEPVHEILTPEELPGEKFRSGTAYVGKYEYKIGFEIEGSNYGRIRHDTNILKQYNSKPGYAYLLFNIEVNGKTIKVPVHRVIAMLWCNVPNKMDISELEVHHISNNGYDNRPSNLLFVNRRDHGMIHNLKSTK